MAASNQQATPEKSAHDRAVGMRLRALRKQKRVSLQSLASDTGLSIGYISQIERGISSASVRVLALVCDRLGFGLDAVFRQAEAQTGAPTPFAFRISERRGLGFWRDGIEKSLLTPGDGHVLNMYLVEIAPGGSSGESDYTHAGEEAGYVLEGELTLQVDGRQQVISEGEAFRFKSNRPHRFGNPTAARCAVLWINAI